MSAEYSPSGILMSNHLRSNHLTSNDRPGYDSGRSTSRGSISSKRSSAKGTGTTMDAVTSFELEAQRRRETVASDRDLGWRRAAGSTETVEARIVAPQPARRALGGQPECESAPLARQA